MWNFGEVQENLENSGEIWVKIGRLGGEIVENLRTWGKIRYFDFFFNLGLLGLIGDFFSFFGGISL